jgi:predicted RNA binding protein with dsRBD fold (UPF0201 family)
MNCILSDNVRTYIVFILQCQKAFKTTANWLKRAETNLALIVFRIYMSNAKKKEALMSPSNHSPVMIMRLLMC